MSAQLRHLGRIYPMDPERHSQQRQYEEPERYSRRREYGEPSSGQWDNGLEKRGNGQGMAREPYSEYSSMRRTREGWEEYGASSAMNYSMDPSSRGWSKGSLRGSGAPFSPDTDDGDPVEPSVEDMELARKKKELEVIEEKIARKKAVLAMRELKHSAKDMPKSQIASTTAKGMSKQRKVNNITFKRYNNVADKSSRLPLKQRVLDIVNKLRRTPVGYLLRKDTPAKPKKRNKIRALEMMISASLENEEAHPLRLRVRALTNQRRYPNNEEVVPNDKQHNPTIQRPVHSLRTQEKDIAATGFQRFVNVLNEGVDINKLSKVVNNENELLIVGEELPQIWPTLLEGNVDSSSRSKSSPPVEEKKKVRLEDEQRYERMQTLLEIVGLDLGVEELGRLTDRTNDRLYGKIGDLKRKENEKGKEKEEREPSFKHLSTSSLPSDSASPSPLLNQHSNLTVEYSSSSNRVWDIERHRDRSERDWHRYRSERDRDRYGSEQHRDPEKDRDGGREKDRDRESDRDRSERDRDPEKDRDGGREKDRDRARDLDRSERDRDPEKERDGGREKDRDRSERDRDRYRSERDRDRDPGKGRDGGREKDRDRVRDGDKSERDRNRYRSERDRNREIDKDIDRWLQRTRDGSIELNSYSMNPIYPVSHPPHASMIATYSTTQYSQYMVYQSSPYTIAFPPGWGYPPGTMPPGTMLPGIMPPGTMPPGFMPPGIMPSGAMPPCTMLPGIMPPGTMLPGIIPTGAMPPGIMPRGIMPAGTMLPGKKPLLPNPPGIMPTGIMPAGAMPPCTMLPGIMPPGTMLPGIIPTGAMPPGIMPPGIMPAGAIPPGKKPLLPNPPGDLPYTNFPPYYSNGTTALNQTYAYTQPASNLQLSSTQPASTPAVLTQRYTYIQPSSNHHLAYTQPASNHHLAYTQPASNHHLAYTQPASNHHLAYTQPASNRKEKRQKHAEAVAKVSCQMATKKSPSEPWSMKKAKGGNNIFFTGIFMKSYHSHLRKCQYKLKRLAKRRNKAHQHKIKRLLAEAAGKVAPQVAVKDFPFELGPKKEPEGENLHADAAEKVAPQVTAMDSGAPSEMGPNKKKKLYPGIFMMILIRRLKRHSYKIKVKKKHLAKRRKKACQYKGKIPFVDTTEKVPLEAAKDSGDPSEPGSKKKKKKKTLKEKGGICYPGIFIRVHRTNMTKGKLAKAKTAAEGTEVISEPAPKMEGEGGMTEGEELLADTIEKPLPQVAANDSGLLSEPGPKKEPEREEETKLEEDKLLADHVEKVSVKGPHIPLEPKAEKDREGEDDAIIDGEKLLADAVEKAATTGPGFLSEPEAEKETRGETTSGMIINGGNKSLTSST